MDVSPAQIVSVATAMIPFLEHNDANRALMGANMQRQAVPLMIPQAPLVGTGLEYRAAVDSGDVVVSARAGEVVELDATHIVVEGKGTREAYDLTKFMRSNQGTLIHHKPIVRLGDKVEAGAVLADGSSTDHGELALGANLLVAFMPFEGYNFEDAIVHLRAPREGRGAHLDPHPRVRDRRPLDEARRRGDHAGHPEPLRGVAAQSRRPRHRPRRRRGRLGRPARRQGDAEGRDRADRRGEADPRDLQGEGARGPRHLAQGPARRRRRRHRRQDVLARTPATISPPGVNELVRVYVAKKRKISEGDKLAGRHGNKGVISKIVAQEDMPFLEDGRAVDILLNPLGVPSRMNIGQILETHLGWAAAHGVFAGDGVERDERQRGTRDQRAVADAGCHAGLRRRHGRGRRRRARRPGPRRTPTARSSSSVDKKQPAGRRTSGKVRLFSGRTGEPFEQKVTVGYMYILKLLHLVDDKIHARSTGPYSLVTQQPLGGKAQFGGQRFGEMEVWALEAYGAAYTLQEMLTIKSDDTVGRVKAYEAIVKGENIAEPSIPESFKVLLKEMQSLALDVQRALGGRRRGRGARGGRRAAARRGGARHRPLTRLAARRGAEPAADDAEEVEEGQDRARRRRRAGASGRRVARGLRRCS